MSCTRTPNCTAAWPDALPDARTGVGAARVVISESGSRPGVRDYERLGVSRSATSRDFRPSRPISYPCTKSSGTNLLADSEPPLHRWQQESRPSSYGNPPCAQRLRAGGVGDEQEEVIISLASSQMSREHLADWIVSHLVGREPEIRA